MIYLLWSGERSRKMPNCSVYCCKKRSATSNLQKDGVTFHLFPKDPVLKNKWKNFCNNKQAWVPTKNSVICSEHFRSSDFQALSNNRRKLVIGAIPTLKPSCLCSIMCKPKRERLTSNDELTNSSPTPMDATPSTEQNIPNHTEDILSARERKMLYKIDFQRKKIKRLQATILFLKKKVVRLQETIHNQYENSSASR